MRRTLIPLVGCMTAVLMSGCGSSQALGLSNPASVLAVITKTTSAQGSKLDVNMTLQVNGQTEVIAGSGAFNYTDNEGELNLNIPASGSQKAGTLDEIIVDKILYAKGDEDAKWSKVDLTQVAKSTGVDPSSLSQSQADPTQSLNLLKGASTSITKVGKETLRGAKTTHYHLSLDFDKAAAAAKPADKDALQKAAAAYNHQQVPADVWVDSSSRVRKLSLGIDLSKLAVASASAKPVTGTLTVEEELYDFGTAVKVSAPPADQVQDATGKASAAAANRRRLQPNGRDWMSFRTIHLSENCEFTVRKLI